MNKYQKLKEELELVGIGEMKVYGKSMLPIIESGSLLTYEHVDLGFCHYKIDDIVFCKVGDRIIDAHKIVAIDEDKGYLIANNHGYINGWTKEIYGRATRINGVKI